MGIGNVLTAMVTLAAVVLGGFLSIKTQDRAWRREHSRQWRDARLAAYGEFGAAYREYLAFVMDPTAVIESIPHPRRQGEPMPFFDATGRPYRSKLEATWVRVRLLAEDLRTLEAGFDLMIQLRRVAAARATQAPTEISSEVFADLFKSETEFVDAARREFALAKVSPSWTASRVSSNNG